jgi:hypothetical protein
MYDDAETAFSTIEYVFVPPVTAGEVATTGSPT